MVMTPEIEMSLNSFSSYYTCQKEKAEIAIVMIKALRGIPRDDNFFKNAGAISFLIKTKAFE